MKEKIKEIEQLLAEWKASYEKSITKGNFHHAHTYLGKISGLRAAISVLKQPSNYVNTTDAPQCPECQQNGESGMNFCANCGRQLWHR